MNESFANTIERLELIAAATPGMLGCHIATTDGIVVFSRLTTELFPQASAIKIPILMEVVAQRESGTVSWTQLHCFSEQEQVDGTGILSAFSAGESKISTNDLCTLMIVLSDNTATNMLINLVGMSRVNKLMTESGCPRTQLLRLMRDQDAIKRGIENLSTPQDAARIMQILANGEFIDKRVSDDLLAILRKPKSSAIRKGIPSEISIAGKPGAVSGVATEWALIELPKRPYIITLMGKNGEEGSFLKSFTEIAETVHQAMAKKL